MGNLLAGVWGSESVGSGGSKRKVEEVLGEDEDLLDLHSVLHTPKKRKFNSTSKYIYKTLFEEGRASDVTVVALGTEWHLHKVYLCQSPYFSSMFSGNWSETNQSQINIEILDDNINIDALHLALGQFYKDDIEVEAAQVIPLLATALLLQMDPLIEQCTGIMLETINLQTVLQYHEAARRYGVVEVEKACKQWLLHNLLTQVTEHPSTLRHIPPDLMDELLSSAHLYVMQTEFSIYVMLKAWVFLKLNPSWEGSHEVAFLEAHKFFRNRTEPGWFLEAEGREFSTVFTALRIVYLIYHHLDVEMLYSDRILPPSWLTPASMHQWYNMLRIDQGKDRGPSEIPEEEFDKSCTRCGRVLANSGQHIWRWTGYNFGLDLVMTHDGSVLTLKRNHRSEYSAQPPRRYIMYRVTVASLNEQKQVVYTQTTGVQSASLVKNEEIRVMLLDSEVKYPLLLSANFLITTNQPLLAAGGDKTSSVAPSLPGPGAFNDSCLQRIAQ
ncbi:Protein germ cell-less [Portunus trituberculatus]|uniref:Protein germ cell-less n=1 Tax=Portunus trituberculatus TaxID=210409 RepID=A0A5B7E695_PORTR|nr:Protein germ cell-less [Portunus trituberculatus]